METTTRHARQTTARDLVAVVFRQKWVILTVFAITTISVFLFTLRTPTTYESSARLALYRGRVESAQNPNMRVLSWEEEMASELETVRSYPVARRAQEILDAWHEEGELSQTVRLNRGGVEARVVGESSVLEVSYSSQDAAVCRPVTNALSQAYSEFRRESMQIPGVEAFFEREIEAVRSGLAALESEKQEFLDRVGPLGSAKAVDVLSTMLNQRDFELLRVTTELKTKRRQLATLQNWVAEERLDIAPLLQLGFENGETLSQLHDQVAKLRVELGQKEVTLTPNHPDYRSVAEALAGAEGLLRGEIRSTLELLESEVQYLGARERDLSFETNRIQGDLASIPSNQVVLGRLDTQIDLKRQELRDLTTKQTASRVNEATAPNVTVTLLSPAGAPYARNTRDYVRMALAPLMSLVVGLLLAFFIDSLDHTLRSPSEVEEHLGLPVLAALPDSQR